MKRTPLRAMSARRRAQMPARRAAVADLFADSDRCQIRSPICRGRADAPHELLKRSRGGSITDPGNLVRACNPCNGYVEDWPLWAEEHGWALPSRPVASVVATLPDRDDDGPPGHADGPPAEGDPSNASAPNK